MPESSRFGHLPWLVLSVLILVVDRVTRDQRGRAVEFLRAVADADRVALVYDALPVDA